MFPYVSSLPFQRFGNPLGNYASMVSCLDTTADVTGYNPTANFGGFAGFDSSIFNPGCMSGCYGWGPGSEFMNMSMDQYLDKMNELKNLEMKRNITTRQYANALNFSADAEEDEIKKAAGHLNDLIKGNRIDEIYRIKKDKVTGKTIACGAYPDLLRAVKENCKRAGMEDSEIDKNIRALALTAYTDVTKTNLLDDIKTHCDSSFVQGLKQGLGFGYGENVTNSTTRDEVLSRITYEGVPTGSEHSRKTGKIISEVLTGAAALGVILLLGKGGMKLLNKEGRTERWFATIDKQIKTVEKEKAALRNHIIDKHGLEKEVDDFYTMENVFNDHLEYNQDDKLVKSYRALEATIDQLHKNKADRYTGILTERAAKLTKGNSKASTSALVAESTLAPPPISASIDEEAVRQIRMNMNVASGANSGSV